MNQENLFDQYERVTANLDMPINRKRASGENARWFLRHGWITNRNHRDFAKARSVAQKIAALN